MTVFFLSVNVSDRLLRVRKFASSVVAIAVAFVEALYLQAVVESFQGLAAVSFHLYLEMMLFTCS